MKRRFAAVCAAVVLLAACGGDDAPAKISLYDRAPVPAVPDRTTAIGAADQTPFDGLYWAEAPSVDNTMLVVALTQAFFADACLTELGEENCPNDYGTLDEPYVLWDIQVATLVDVTVVAENQQNYAITAEELFSLASGNPPSADAPDGYQYLEFPFLLTMRDGKIVEAHQIWVP